MRNSGRTEIEVLPDSTFGENEQMRRRLVQVHLWSGLVVGLLWAFLGLTGSILVFHREVDRFLGPPPTPGTMASLDEITKNAKSAANGAPIVRLAVTTGKRDMIYAYYEKKSAGHVDQGQRMAHGHAEHMAVVIDAATAQAVGIRDMNPSTPFSSATTSWVMHAHFSLLSGRIGEIVVGVSGILLTSAALLGFWIGWPRRNAWKSIFRFTRSRDARQRLYGWHRAVGLVAGSVIILSAISGVYITFSGEIRNFAANTLPYHALYTPAAVDALPESMISPQKALDIAMDEFPEAHWVRVFFPTEAAPVYSVRVRLPGEGRAWLGASRVILDAGHGRVLEAYDSTAAPVTNRILDAGFALHNGDLLRLPGRIAMFLGGLALPTLYITGVLAWLRRRRQKRSGSTGKGAVRTPVRDSLRAP